MLRLEQLQASIRTFTKDVIKGRLPGLFVVGPGGLGKSFTVIETFREAGLDPPVLNSHLSPLGLYELLHRYRDGPVLVLEDMENVFRNTTILSLLRSALWGQKNKEGRPVREVTWNSTTQKLEDLELPQEFEFSSGIIMIANRLPERNDFFDALKTRVPTLVLRVEPSEVYEFMRKIMRKGKTIYDEGKKRAYKIPSLECLKVLAHFQTKGVSNFRRLEHALVLYHNHKRKDAWKELVDHMLASDVATHVSDEEVVTELVGQKDLKDSERLKTFCERTGHGRATYFRVKQRLGLTR